MSTPTTIDNFKSPALYLRFNFIFNLLRLAIVPYSEKTHFCIAKSSICIPVKLFYNSINNVHNWVSCSEGVGARIIFISCFYPANVVVRVWNEMNHDLLVLMFSRFMLFLFIIFVSIFFLFLFTFFNSLLVFVVTIFASRSCMNFCMSLN